MSAKPTDKPISSGWTFFFSRYFSPRGNVCARESTGSPGTNVWHVFWCCVFRRGSADREFTVTLSKWKVHAVFPRLQQHGYSGDWSTRTRRTSAVFISAPPSRSPPRSAGTTCGSMRSQALTTTIYALFPPEILFKCCTSRCTQQLYRRLNCLLNHTEPFLSLQFTTLKDFLRPLNFLWSCLLISPQGGHCYY